MIKDLTCIECPRSCALRVDIENCRVVKVTGEKCPKGKDYAVSEVENPQRVLTSAIVVAAHCAATTLKMIPVRTDKPIPKERILEAAEEIRKLKVDRPVKSGEVIAANLLGLGVNVIATRDCV